MSSHRDSLQAFALVMRTVRNFKVPMIGCTVAVLLVNRYGCSASFGSAPSLHSKRMRSVEKLSYFGWLATCMELNFSCYTQQILGTLLDTLQDD